MKLHIASLTVLCLTLAAIPAWAQQYDNGPINGTTDAWNITSYVASDTFVGNGGDLSGFSFGVWETPGDVLSSVTWSISATENGNAIASGVASGNSLTDKFLSENQYLYDIHLISVTARGLNLTYGSTYWLNLTSATVPSGDSVYWDENSGKGCNGIGGGKGCPSSASLTTVGTIPSEAFTVSMGGCAAGHNSPDCGPTPEPSSIVLFGSGILGLAGLLRRKLNL
jgi:PEP-CTERM motif-containing protein